VVELLSTGEVRRRLGVSSTYVRRLAREGTIPRPVVIVGSGKFVWQAHDWPAIERAVRERPDRRRRDRAAA